MLREERIPFNVPLSSSSSDGESSEPAAVAGATTPEGDFGSGSEENDAKVKTAVAADEEHGHEELGASGADADVEAAEKKNCTCGSP